jgi:hypothetical protein
MTWKIRFGKMALKIVDDRLRLGGFGVIGHPHFRPCLNGYDQTGKRFILDDGFDPFVFQDAFDQVGFRDGRCAKDAFQIDPL